MHSYLLLMAFIATMLLGGHSVEATEYKTVVYTVSGSDTLDIIARKYLPADRGDSDRAFKEFKEGIYEYNYETVFIHRLPYEVHKGDCLLITLWE
jgi:hypothetical protein